MTSPSYTPQSPDVQDRAVSENKGPGLTDSSSEGPEQLTASADPPAPLSLQDKRRLEKMRRKMAMSGVKHVRMPQGFRMKTKTADYIHLRDGSIRRLVTHPENPSIQIVSRKAAKRAGVLPDHKGRVRVRMGIQLETIDVNNEK